MKILVTGATGFIGNYVIDQLLYKGYEVVATSTSKEKAVSFNWYPQVKYVEFNINDIDPGLNYFDFFDRPDALIHLSWEGLPNYKEAFHIEKNLPAQYAFLKNLIKNGLNDVTVSGTCFEYGMQEGILSEDMEAKPENFYAQAKDSLRKQLEGLKYSYHFNLKWVRLFYMYGQGQSSKSLISQLDKALENGDEVFNMSGGEQQRDFLPVEKVAAYIVSIATQNLVLGIINCCKGEPISVKQFVQNYLLQHKKTIRLNLGYYPYADYEPMAFWGSPVKLHSLLPDTEI